jgi:hypothetical protein
MWYDETGNSWQNGENWGVATLEEKSPVPTNNLTMWFVADRGLTFGDDGVSVLKWENQGTADVTMEAEVDSAPQLSTNENCVPALLFDGTTNSLSFDGVNFNDKSELSLILVTHYTGPTVDDWSNDWTSGDKYSAQFVTESGGWGSLFISPYHDWVSTRFGTGEWFCNIKHQRPSVIDSTSITISVKDGTTEKMYIDGENVLVKEEQGETTQNIGSTMYIGKSISDNTDCFFEGTISEILIYDRALSDVEVTQISNYLNQKHQMVLDTISITGPAKTEYEIDDELDLTGLVVTAHYSDGSEAEVSGYEVTGFDSSIAGDKVVTISYQDITATFTVTVKESPAPVVLDTISITEPAKTEYEIDDELDLTGLVVTAHYSDGSEAEVSGYEVTGFDSSTAGDKVVTISYQDITATFTVTVKESPAPVVLDTISITEPAKTEYEIDDELDLTGLVVTAHYSDGSEAEVSGYEVTGFDSSIAGDKVVTISYQDITATFTVTVKVEDTNKPTEPQNPEPTTPITEPAQPTPAPEPKPDQNVGVDETALVVSNSSSLSLSAKADKEAFDEDVIISVKEISNASDEGIRAIEQVRELIGDFEKIMLLDIKAMKQTGQVYVQPKEGMKVTIKVKIPDSFNLDEIAIVHITDEDEIELLEFVIEGENITFEVESFSTFAIAEQTTITPNPEDEEESSDDQTEDLTKNWRKYNSTLDYTYILFNRCSFCIAYPTLLYQNEK